MKHTSHILIVTFMLEILSFSLSIAQWKYLGLVGRTVEVLYAHNDFLYAGTDSGILRKHIDLSDTTWISLGLESKQITSLLVLNDSAFIASVYMNSNDTISLYKSTNGGAHWFPYQNGFGGDTYKQIRDLVMLQSQPEILFAVGGAIGKSTDGGVNWRRVFGNNWDGVSFYFIAIDPFKINIIWAGGESYVFSPYLVKSISLGESWQYVFPDIGGDDQCLSIAFSPIDTNVAYVGTGNCIIKTIDGGINWFPIFTTSEYFYKIVSSRDSILYTAARIPMYPNRMSFYRSSNGGTSWDTLTFNTTQTTGVKDILVLQNDNIDNLFFGTVNGGVYSYANIITAVDKELYQKESMLFSLQQNYPNPFNSETIIRFNVAYLSRVKIDIFDLLGKRVETIVDADFTPGEYSTRFTARNLTTGIYFYRICADRFIKTKKFLLIR